MEVTEVQHQRLSTLLASFLECDECKCIVGFNEAQQSDGCPICKTPNRVRTIYFGHAVHSLIDLMQEFYHLKKDTKKASIQIGTDSSGNHRLAVVIFFCSLAEVLLDGFLRESMDKVSIPDKLQDKLFRDNKSFIQKLSLFESLTGAKIKNEAIKLSTDCELDYSKVIEFHRLVKDARNRFLHKGYKNVIDKNMPKECLLNVSPLLNLFVALHNKYLVNLVGNRLVFLTRCFSRHQGASAISAFGDFSEVLSFSKLSAQKPWCD